MYNLLSNFLIQSLSCITCGSHYANKTVIFNRALPKTSRECLDVNCNVTLLGAVSGRLPSRVKTETNFSLTSIGSISMSHKQSTGAISFALALVYFAPVQFVQGFLCCYCLYRWFLEIMSVLFCRITFATLHVFRRRSLG